MDNTEVNIFERASRQALLFDTPQGKQSTEDLWNLPLTSTSTAKANLDSIAMELNNKLQTTPKVSFVTATTSTDKTTELKFAIVKRIIEVKLAEKVSKDAADANKAKRQEIMAIIAAKKTEALSTASIDELNQMLASIT